MLDDLVGALTVEEYSPMKRGLKVERRTDARRLVKNVEEYSPMKRGLKGRPSGSPSAPRGC